MEAIFGHSGPLQGIASAVAAPCSIGVSIGPGAIALASIPFFASVLASQRTKACTPPLLAP